MLKSRNSFCGDRKWKWAELGKVRANDVSLFVLHSRGTKKKRIWLISSWTSELKGLAAVCSSTQNLHHFLDFHNFSIIRGKTRQFSKQFSLTAIETQENWRHRIWSPTIFFWKNHAFLFFFFFSKFLSHTEAFSRWENRENLIENVLLVCFALKVFSEIKMSISRCRASKVERSKKCFVGKKFIFFFWKN